ncbi:MAG: hypothetical protein ACREQ5_31045 [Candidatus Dormibacteria bacterium]
MSDSFAGVRMVRPEDEEAVFSLLTMLHAENGIFPMSEDRIRDTVRQATARKGGIIGVIDGEDGPEATTGLFMEQLWYSDAWWLVERWNFVHPDRRRTTHAKRMIEFAKWCADNLTLDLLMGIVTNTRTEAKVRLYRRQLPYVGGFFLHKHVNGEVRHLQR